MTRKKYLNRIRDLVLAIYRHPDSVYPDGYKIGTSLRHVRDNAKNAPKTFGSYEAAWNCEAIKGVRKHFGLA